MTARTKNLSCEQRFYFLHIPKTAGTTFTSILHAQFSPEEICPAYHLHEFAELSEGCRANYKLYRGHFYYRVEAFLPFTPIYLTFIREPVARFISNYQHIRATAGHLLNRTNTLAEFLDDPEARKRIANFQTRSLGLTLMNREKSWFQRAGMPVLQAIEEAMPIRLSEDELLDCAKRRLSACRFFGITELFEESLELLENSFGWRRPTRIESLNKSRQPVPPEEISRECLEKIRELNTLDLQLYEHGKNLFSQRQASTVKEAGSLRFDIPCDQTNEKTLE